METKKIGLGPQTKKKREKETRGGKREMHNRKIGVGGVFSVNGKKHVARIRALPEIESSCVPVG